MFKLIIGRSFEFEYTYRALYLRVGKRDWYYSHALALERRYETYAEQAKALGCPIQAFDEWRNS